MKAAAFLMSLIVLPVALPAHAKDSDDLSSWSLEKLCEKADKARHADAVFAEIERRGAFSAQDLELVRSGNIDLGMGEAALQCSWGEPDAVSQSDGDSWQTYRPTIDGQLRAVFVNVIAGQVTNIYVRPAGYNAGGTPLSVYSILCSDDRLLSGRRPFAPAGVPGVVGCWPLYTGFAYPPASD